MFYTDIFYGGDYFAGTDEEGFAWGGPVNLNAYQNNADNVVLYWSFQPYNESINDMVWEIQTDTVDTFDSSDLHTYYSDELSESEYISGCVHKGISIPIYPRLQDEIKSMYWRVRAWNAGDSSRWAEDVFSIPPAVDETARNFMMSFLPDVLYKKEQGSNIYGMLDTVALAFEEWNKYATLINNDNYVKSVRDVSIEKNFGELLDITKPYGMKMIDYREIVKGFMYQIRSAPAEKAVSEFLQRIYGSYPAFVNIEDVATMYVGSTGATTDPEYVEPFYTYDAGHSGSTMAMFTPRPVPDIMTNPGSTYVDPTDFYLLNFTGTGASFTYFDLYRYDGGYYPPVGLTVPMGATGSYLMESGGVKILVDADRLGELYQSCAWRWYVDGDMVWTPWPADDVVYNYTTGFTGDVGATYTVNIGSLGVNIGVYLYKNGVQVGDVWSGSRSDSIQEIDFNYDGIKVGVLFANGVDLDYWYWDWLAEWPIPLYGAEPPVEAPIVWDDRHLAYGVLLQVANRFGVDCNEIFTQLYVLSIIKKMIQAHTPIYLEYF